MDFGIDLHVMQLLELECFVNSAVKSIIYVRTSVKCCSYLLHSSSDYGNIRQVSVETYWVLVSFWKSYSGSYIIFYSIWVKFGIRELLILLGSIPFAKIGPGKAVFMVVNVSIRTLTRVPWNRMLFWTQRRPRARLCTTSQSTLFAVLHFSFSSWNVWLVLFSNTVLLLLLVAVEICWKYNHPVRPWCTVRSTIVQLGES
jgi:hypothetical protein